MITRKRKPNSWDGSLSGPVISAIDTVIHSIRHKVGGISCVDITAEGPQQAHVKVHGHDADLEFDVSGEIAGQDNPVRGIIAHAYKLAMDWHRAKSPAAKDKVRQDFSRWVSSLKDRDYGIAQSVFTKGIRK